MQLRRGGFQLFASLLRSKYASVQKMPCRSNALPNGIESKIHREAASFPLLLFKHVQASVGFPVSFEGLVFGLSC
jgi:hypothetical protein